MFVLNLFVGTLYESKCIRHMNKFHIKISQIMVYSNHT